ncbi:PGF-CTERM sorting domain-containing protein (plasmid) [Halolamina sp. CBA1230]|uniref:BGTF surface domain-containing protein n=1 Tax=Halolamina sp. CBA1230 TaxID=1853690 RepID=UPI0009A1F444|nr:BGTF surface domain-containing protein [Halolamina sp. CBA1230]QKY22256.1 PGF-CTERM sorting domain-containing protein [Halolamina sp. CBA1230]
MNKKSLRAIGVTALMLLSVVAISMPAAAAPQAALTASDPGPVQQGETFQVTYELTNDGDEDAGSAGMQFQTPDGVEIDSFDGSGAGAVDQESYFLVTGLDEGETHSVTVTFQVASDAATGDNTVTATADVGDQSSSTVDTSVTIESADDGGETTPTPDPEPPEDDAPEETSDGAIVFSGENVVFDTAGDTGSDQYVLRSGSPDDSNTAERTLNVQDNGLIVIDTGGLDTGSYYITNDGTNSADLSFEVIVQDFSASFATEEIGNIGAAGDTTVEFESDNRGAEDFGVFVTSENLDDDELADIFGVENTDVDGDGDASDDGVRVENIGDGTEYGVSFADIDAGNYTFDFAVTDTTATASADIEVSDTSEGAASFAHTGSLNVPQGGVAEITIDLTGAASSGTLVVGDQSQDGYQANVSFEDNNDDGEVTVQFNTYLAGNATADDSAIVSAAGEDDSAELTGQSELSAIAAQGDYTLAVSTAGSASQALDDPQELSTLFLAERSTDGMTMWTAPGNADLDANEDGAVTADDVSALIEAGAVTQDSSITMGDYAIHEISATGVEGLISAEGGLAEAIADGSLDLTVEQTNQIQNRDPKTLNVTNSLNAIEVIDGDGAYYVLVDLESADFERNGEEVDLANGDEFEATFTVADDRLLNSESDDDHESVSATFDVESPSVEFDSEPVEVAAAANQMIAGQTNQAPGTELTIRVRSVDTQPGFYHTETVTVGEDGNFAAEFDFSDQSAGDTFTVSVRKAGSEQLNVEGEVVEQVGTATPTTTAEPTPTATAEPTSTGTAEPTSTATAEPTDEPPEEDTTTTTTPGFGVAVALVALLAAALLAGRRE